MSSTDFELFLLFGGSCFVIFSCGCIAGALLGRN